jgi:hypothetical protein
MKFELKTENQSYIESFSYIFRIVFILSLIIVFCDLSLKLGFISRYYQIDSTCKLLFVEKSTSNFNKLSRLSNLKSKQRIWEFCKEFVK